MGEDLEVVWMTYDEAARALRIKPDSVRRRAASRKWAKRLGNDKLARVGIPRDIIPDVTPEPSPDVTPDNPDESEKLKQDLQSALLKINELEGAVLTATAKLETLEQHLSDAQADRDSWRAQAKELLTTQTKLTEQLSSLAKTRTGIFGWLKRD